MTVNVELLEEDILEFKSMYGVVRELAYSQPEKVLPKQEDLLNFLEDISLLSVKVVIVGQEPYPMAGYNDGRAFSMQVDKDISPVLLNIFKEIKTSLGHPIPENGSLKTWTNQGVILLNRTLTVLEGSPKSHSKLGWNKVTDRLVKLISDHKDNVVFMLWGTQAFKLTKLIDKDKHLLLTAPYPSPLSASRGFFGCDHFRKANLYLEKQGIGIIDWRV